MPRGSGRSPRKRPDSEVDTSPRRSPSVSTVRLQAAQTNPAAVSAARAIFVRSITGSTSTPSGEETMTATLRDSVVPPPPPPSASAASGAHAHLAGTRAHAETGGREHLGRRNQEALAVLDRRRVDLRDVGGGDEPLHHFRGAVRGGRGIRLRVVDVAHRNLWNRPRFGRWRRARATTNAAASPAASRLHWILRVRSVMRSHRAPDGSSTRTPAGRFHTSPAPWPGRRSRNERAIGTSVRPRWDTGEPVWSFVSMAAAYRRPPGAEPVLAAVFGTQ